MTKLTEAINELRQTNSDDKIRQMVEEELKKPKSEMNIETLLNQLGLETLRGGF